MTNEMIGVLALLSIVILAVSGAIWIVKDYKNTKA